MDTATTSVKSFHAGKIHTSKNMCVIFDCEGCDGKFGIYTKFLDHIFGEHFEDWTATENPKNILKETENKNEDKMEIASVQKYHAGDLYVTSNFCIKIDCKACEETFRVHAKFLDHIYGKHFEDWIATGKPKNIPSENTKKHDEYLEIERVADEECPSESDFITEILQPMKDETYDGKDSSTEQESLSNTNSEASFKNVRLFKIKLKNHELKSEHKCKTCGFLASNVHNLKGHELRHSAIKPFACLKCDKSFYTSTELNTHIRRHTGDKPYVCTYCGLGFVNSSQLTNHEKRHTGDRRFKCDQCDKRFYDSMQLKTHSVVHTKERNYKCEECNSKFTRQNALRSHRKLHVNALQYECMICHMHFNQKPTLLWHIKSKHNVIKKGKEDNIPERFGNPIEDGYDYT